jgi:hypothetical protein
MSIVVTPIPQLIELAAPAFTLGAANAAGSAATAVASDSTLLMFDATAVDAITLGQTGSVGTATVAPRRDHAHAMEAVTAATQAEMEADSSTTVFVTPGRAKYFPGAAKVWGLTNTVNVLTGDYNMTGITQHGTGDNTFTYDVDFSSNVYLALVTVGGGGRICHADVLAVGSSRVHTADADAPYGASNAVTNFAAFGDQ